MVRMHAMQQRQRGLTMISWAIIMAVIAFFAMMAIRLFPVYMEHFSVVSSMTSLVADEDARGKSPLEIQTRLFKRFEVNDVTSVTADDVTITRDGEANTVNIVYDVQVPFLYNIDFLVHFNDTVEVGAR